MKKRLLNIDRFLNKYPLKRTYLKESAIRLETNANTYLPKEEMTTGWLQNLYKTFTENENLFSQPQSMALIGVGPAVEALLFIEIFKLKKLYCFDINKGVLAAARNNIVNNLKHPENLELTVEQSDLLNYMITNEIKVDLIYENLPNLRISEKISMENGITSSSFFSEEKSTNDDVPSLYDVSNLRLHYRFLIQAKKCLTKSGKVICCIGARIPITNIKTMFNDLGYNFRILHIGLVEQLAASEVIEIYSEDENNKGMEFLFLPHNDRKIKELINNYKPDDNLSILYNAILRLGFNAASANVKLANRERIDHIGLIIEGTLDD